MDNTTISLSALKPNLQLSLDLLADVVRNPALTPAEVERKRAALLARIAAEKTEPQGLAMRVLPPLLYGAAHPYGVPFTGSAYRGRREVGDPRGFGRLLPSLDQAG